MNLLLGSNKWSNHVHAISSTHRAALSTSEEMNMPTTFLLQELLLYMFVNTNPYYNNPHMQIELSKFLFKTSTNHECIKNRMGTSQCKFAWQGKRKKGGVRSTSITLSTYWSQFLVFCIKGICKGKELLHFLLLIPSFLLSLLLQIILPLPDTKG